MIAYINDLEEFGKVARELGFYNYEEIAHPNNNAFSKSIFILDNYPIRIRIRVYKSSRLVEVKAFKYCGKCFKELPSYLKWSDIKTHLKTIEKYIVWEKLNEKRK